MLEILGLFKIPDNHVSDFELYSDTSNSEVAIHRSSTRIDAPKNFSRFLKKMRWGPIFIRVTCLKMSYNRKRNSTRIFSRKFSKMFHNNYFFEYLCATASYSFINIILELKYSF